MRMIAAMLIAATSLSNPLAAQENIMESPARFAGAILAEAARTIGGGGRPNPEVTLVGGKAPENLPDALEQARAGLARAESHLQNARRTHKRQQDLVSRGATSDAQRDDALNRVRIAVATLISGKSQVSRSRTFSK